MAIRKPLHIPGRRLVLTKNMILDAQDNTKSAASAARWLNVSYNTYKKWAQYYKIFDQHKNQTGVGIKKGWATYKVPIDDIITGKRQPPRRWSHKVFKQRLVEEGYFNEECHSCSYSEENIQTKKVCLAIDFKDGDHNNFSLNNLRFLCPNCYLSYNGRFSSSKTFCK